MGRCHYSIQKLAGVCAVIVHKSQIIYFFKKFVEHPTEPFAVKVFGQQMLKPFTGLGFIKGIKIYKMKYQTLYLYKTLATCGFAKIIIFLKRCIKKFCCNQKPYIIGPVKKIKKTNHEQS